MRYFSCAPLLLLLAREFSPLYPFSNMYDNSSFFMLLCYSRALLLNILRVTYTKRIGRALAIPPFHMENGNQSGLRHPFLLHVSLHDQRQPSCLRIHLYAHRATTTTVVIIIVVNRHRRLRGVPRPVV